MSFAQISALMPLMRKQLSRLTKALPMLNVPFGISKPILISVRSTVYQKECIEGHVCLCMLISYIEWPMRQALAPMLFQDDDPQSAKRLWNR